MRSEDFESYLCKNRIPIHATIQLTYHCNFRCVHCYETPLKDNRNKELSFEDWKRILHVLHDNGCLFLAFTGGEILTVPFWNDIYKFAYDLGFKITITTNGSLITPEIIDMFSRKKPEQVHISLYGMSESTYSCFCRKSGVFPIVTNNILALRESDINTVIMFLTNTINFNDLNGAIAFAKKSGCMFYQFYHMRSYVDGNCSPKKYRLDPEKLVAIQPLDELSILKYKVLEDKQQWTAGYKSCNAGLTSITIDPYGNAFLCDSIPGERYNLLDTEFKEAWSNLYAQRKKYIEIPSVCSACEKRELCGLCAPTLLMEYGSCQKRPSRECSYSATLRNALGGL